MSTGAWIFASVVAAAVIAPTAVYAAATSTVAIGNTNSNATASVTTSHQLLTTTVAAKDVVAGQGFTGGGCSAVYVPPAGKAIVVTSVTYDSYGNSSGLDHYTYLMDSQCYVARDVVDTHQVDVSEPRIFPIGLPMPSLGIYGVNGSTRVYFTGYLIPASQLPPAAAPAAKLPTRGLHASH